MDRSLQPTAPKAPPVRARAPLSPQEQLEAARRVMAQAEQRVMVSKKLFEAVQTRTVHNQNLLEQFKAAQDDLRKELHRDVAASLRDYDQWMGRIDEGFTAKMRALETRLAALENQMGQAQQHVEDMLGRAESLLEQSRAMLDTQNESPPKAAKPLPVDDADAEPQAADATEPVDPSPIYSQLLRRLRGRAGDEEAA